MTRSTGFRRHRNQLRVVRALLVAMIGLSFSSFGRQGATGTVPRTEETSEVKETLRSHALASHHFVVTDSVEYFGDSFKSTWRAGTTSVGLRFVRELMSDAYAVQRDRLFEFDSTGALVYYVEHSSSIRQRDIDRRAAYIGSIELEFAGGEAVYRARRPSGASRLIRQWEVDRVLERAELLRRTSSAP